ncbi:hypothetical protein ALC62_02783 [Cyphomyrmex costatus]|uniref:Uncharacterized protein n=1 Tax=Cyphomyrmex costatus TaxID=456900 RepID=A0A151IMY3_9HYME|nr:hypothetical protein ALC62_02783 [Cyphomyrmex costatus]
MGKRRREREWKRENMSPRFAWKSIYMSVAATSARQRLAFSETICQIRCVIVVINDSHYHSEALTRRGVKETVITRSCDTR